MPTELLTRDERTALEPTPVASDQEAELRAFAREHLDRVRRLRFHVAAYVVGMALLTPIWALTQWQDNGGFQQFDFSPDGGRGDWEPWILWVAIVWGGILAFYALKVHFDRPTTEAQVDREVERLRPQS